MKRFVSGILAAALLASPVALAPVAAQDWHGDHRDGRDRDYSWQGGPDRRDWDASENYHKGRYKARRLGRDDYVYRGRDNRYYCKRNDGSTGLVVGAIGGGLLGGAIGGDALGAIIGAGAGGLLGRSVDRGQVKCR